jgi:serine/threonine protein kinase
LPPEAKAEPAAKPAPLPARFEPIALLSRARTYEVWDAWDPERACRVVLKAVRADRAGDAGARARLLAEGDLLERLRHPHIVGAYETVTGPPAAIVMETLGGATLAQIVDEEEPLEVAEIAHLALHLVSAVAYMHRRDRLHLDLKPSNVIAEAGRARLIDLGLAGPPGRVAPGLGTWSYLAPEQVDGERVGAAADVWGLGAVMFECVCGFPPFDDPAHEGDDGSGEDGWPGRYPQLTRTARPVAAVRATDPALAALIAACLTAEPERRPDLAELASGLEEVAGLEPAERRVSRSVRA